jgi:hypothetical protein
MCRTQISIEDEQHAYLEREARSAGISIAELLRRMITERMREQSEAHDPLEALAGLAEGDGAPAGREHDRYLHGALRT